MRLLLGPFSSDRLEENIVVGSESMKKYISQCVLSIIVIFVLCQIALPENSFADSSELVKGKKVLIVASYHKGHRSTDDIVVVIERELAGAELTFFYMDTKKNLGKAEEKAREAFILFQKQQPDAVITIDDNAQFYFVVPYLKDKVSTPVIFCGVNDEATKYGFPASNVTGVLEKKHYRESIGFAQILDSKVKTITILYKPSPSNTINLEQIEKEKGNYSADIIGIVAVSSVADIRNAIAEYSAKVDAFLLLNMTGVVDDDNKQLEGHEAIVLVVDATDLVTIGASDWEVETGVLCGVIKSGEEQGGLAVIQLISYWEGKAIKDLPVIQNKNGQRYVNLKTMKKLQLKLRPEMIIGTKIISGQ